jgi:hypothetical protein
MTEIVVGKEALKHLLATEGVLAIWDEPKDGEFYGSVENARGYITFRYTDKKELK